MIPSRGGSLVAFFVLTYGVMWAAFITVAAAPIPAHSPLGTILLLAGAYSPSVVALSLAAWHEGGPGVRALVDQVLRWQVAARWYVFAAVYTVTIKLTAALVHRAITDSWPRFGAESLYLIPFAIALSTPFQAGEEIGWRGYALPRMGARLGLAPASVLLGVIWACWHLPQFFIREANTYGQSFPLYLLQVTAISVAMAWLYTRTGQSLLPVMVLHAAVNNSKDIVPSATAGATDIITLRASTIAWITVLLLWICAAYFLWWMARRDRMSA